MSNTSKITATIITRMITDFRFIREPFPALCTIRTRPVKTQPTPGYFRVIDEVAHRNGSRSARDSPGLPAALTCENDRLAARAHTGPGGRPADLPPVDSLPRHAPHVPELPGQDAPSGRRPVNKLSCPRPRHNQFQHRIRPVDKAHPARLSLLQNRTLLSSSHSHAHLRLGQDDKEASRSALTSDDDQPIVPEPVEMGVPVACPIGR